MENLLAQATQLLLVIGCLAFIVMIITQVTKGVSFLKKIPTDIEVFVLSIVFSILALIIYAQTTGITIIWYYILAAVILGFVVSFICMYGWKKFFILYNRYVDRKEETSE